jgi:FkbM family methyltransferase
MKRRIKHFLQKKNLYYSLKYSRLFRLYQLLFKPAEIKEERREISFYRSFLPASKLIFDIGANDGHKTQAFLSIAGKVICCEPDKQNFQLLQSRFRNNKENVILENVALSDNEGTAVMHIHHPGSAFNTLSSKWKKVLEADNIRRWDEPVAFSQQQTVETLTLDKLIGKYGVPDFIKIDVEGFEEHVLRGLTHPIHYLSFETLLPDYASELQNCIRIIEAIDPSAVYNIALHESLIFPGFITRNELENWCKENSHTPSFEVIVKMPV